MRQGGPWPDGQRRGSAPRLIRCPPPTCPPTSSPRAVEGVADERYRPLRPEAPYDVIHGNGALVPLAFEIGAEIPKCQRGVGLALQRFLRQQRRRAVDDRRLFLEIKPAAARQRLQQEPALVERAAGNGKLPAF